MTKETVVIREVLSEGEERFEFWRRSVGLFLGPVVAFIIILIPFSDLSPQAHTLSAILGWVVIYWMTEPIPIPVTALLGPVLCILFGVGTPKEVFAPFAHPVIFLFLGSFLLAGAMIRHRLDRRFALGILSLRWIGDRPTRILFAIGGISAFISMWISNTAATAMMFPIALGILRTVANMVETQEGKQIDLRRWGYSSGLMLIVAYGASVGGVGTLIGTPPNLIGVGIISEQLGVQISFLQWMAFGLPLMLVMYLLLFFLLRSLHRPGRINLVGVQNFIVEQRVGLGPWSRGEINTAVAFLVAVILWTFPGFLALVMGSKHSVSVWYEAHLPEGVAALLAASLLFLLPTDWGRREFTLRWEDAAQVDWGTILLFGGGLSLGDLMFKTGLSAALGNGFVVLFSVHSLWGITAAAILMGIVTSELTSNTASASMVIPMVIAIAKGADLNPLIPALGACLGASYGFMLPISTPPNAIVYGSGMIPITKMIRAGILFDLLGFLIIWVGLRILGPLLGYV